MNKIFISGLFLAIVAGIFIPLGKEFKLFLPILLSLLLFFNFLNINFKMRNILQFNILSGFILVLMIIPSIVFIISIKLDIYLRIGLFLIAITPVAIGSSVIVKLLNGNMELVIMQTLVYNLLAPFSYPLLIKLFFHDTIIHLSVASIFMQLVLIIVVPFILAFLIKRFDWINNKLKFISKKINYLYIIIIYLAVSTSSNEIRNYPLSQIGMIIIFTLIIALLNYILGFFFGNNLMNRKTLAVCTGQKNTGICIWIALTYFPSISTIPAVIYILIHHILNSILLLIFARKEKD